MSSASLSPLLLLASASPRRSALLDQIGVPGSYAIQGYGAVFIRDLAGSYSGVMGLPLFETATLLRQAGIRWTLP